MADMVPLSTLSEVGLEERVCPFLQQRPSRLSLSVFPLLLCLRVASVASQPRDSAKKYENAVR
jgi:hypothetical protein